MEWQRKGFGKNLMLTFFGLRKGEALRAMLQNRTEEKAQATML